jgi:hypothetical protein
MVAVPAASAVTKPVLFIVAIAALPVLHAPPVVVLANVVETPTQAVSVPVMAAGAAGTVLTVTVRVEEVVPQALVTE